MRYSQYGGRRNDLKDLCQILDNLFPNPFFAAFNHQTPLFHSKEKKANSTQPTTTPVEANKIICNKRLQLGTKLCPPLCHLISNTDEAGAVFPSIFAPVNQRLRNWNNP